MKPLVSSSTNPTTHSYFGEPTMCSRVVPLTYHRQARLSPRVKPGCVCGLFPRQARAHAQGEAQS